MTVVSGGRHGIAVFPSSVSEAVYAVDNRCPHMGFPLHKGASPTASSPAIGITPASIWRAAARSIPGPTTSKPIPPSSRTASSTSMRGRGDDRVAHAKARLWDGLEQDLNLVVVKNVLALLEADVPRPRSWRSAVASARPTGAAAGRPV